MTLPTPEEVAKAIVPLCLPSCTESGKLYDFRAGKFLEFHRRRNGAYSRRLGASAEDAMAQPIVEPCSRGVIEAQPEPLAATSVAPPRRRMVLAACMLASSMAFIDGSALTVALPKLRAAVGADLAAVQWVLNGYILALASLTLIGGALADRYGKARILAIGCLLFAAASAACALVPSAAWLIAARVVQGVAAALVTPSSLALIGAIYPKAERNGAIGVWAAASALTTAGWTGARRLADRDLRLAGGVLDQPADRRWRRRVCCGLLRRRRRREPRRFDIARRRHYRRGARRPGLVAEPDRRSEAPAGPAPLVAWPACSGLIGLARLRRMGARHRSSDDAAAAGAQPPLPRAQHRDAADLCGPRHHVFSAAVRSGRPPPFAAGDGRTCRSCRSRWASACCRGRSARSPTRSALASC